MKATLTLAVLLLIAGLGLCLAQGNPFGLAENSLRDVRSIRFENVYTQVPTSGKLVSVKITDNGKTYYICQEKTGYVIYHLEIRLVEELKGKMEEELKEMSRKWDRIQPDELLFTKERHTAEVRKRIHRYSDAVWVREEVIVGQLPKQPAQDAQASK
jgi:hypothetical protein